jgi:hypothetical protein
VETSGGLGRDARNYVKTLRGPMGFTIMRISQTLEVQTNEEFFAECLTLTSSGHSSHEKETQTDTLRNTPPLACMHPQPPLPAGIDRRRLLVKFGQIGEIAEIAEFK